MAQQTSHPEANQPGLNVFSNIAARFSEYGHNASNNLTNAFNDMSLQSWIRLVVIVGGYMLLRPYVMKLGSKFAVNKLEEEDAKSKANEKIDPDMTPNEFRGIKEKLLHAENDDQGDGTSADWGQKARARQRQMLKDLLEEEERRRAAEHEDADIQEFLED